MQLSHSRPEPQIGFTKTKYIFRAENFRMGYP